MDRLYTEKPLKKILSFDCGLTFSPLLISEKWPSSVIAGFYNGITLERYAQIDKASKIHLFEASELQRIKIAEKYYNNPRINICMAALCGGTNLTSRTFKDYSRKTNIHKGEYGYGALDDCIDTQETSTEYRVATMNLKCFLDMLPNKYQSHIHLDIEGAELEVIKEFGAELKYYTHQLSLELEPNKENSLKQQYINLHRASGLQFACIIIRRDGSFPDISEYNDILSDQANKGVHIYMLRPKLISFLELPPSLEKGYAKMINTILKGENI